LIEATILEKYALNRLYFSKKKGYYHLYARNFKKYAFPLKKLAKNLDKVLQFNGNLRIIYRCAIES